jgi:protein TonB
MRVRNANAAVPKPAGFWNRLNPLFLFLGLSVCIHGAVLYLAAEGPLRPFPPEKNRAVPVSLFSITPERKPMTIPPETPAPGTIPAPRIEEAPAPSMAETPPPAAEESAGAAITTTDATNATENITGVKARESGYPPVSAPVIRPERKEAAIKRYAAMIRGLIDKRKEYPYQARRQDQEGTVHLRFTLSRQGILKSEPVTEKQSRYRLLNESALEAVKNAAPFPPFPEEIPEEAMSFQVIVSFSL